VGRARQIFERYVEILPTIKVGLALDISSRPVSQCGLCVCKTGIHQALDCHGYGQAAMCMVLLGDLLIRMLCAP
jgi:hypothetical protein